MKKLSLVTGASVGVGILSWKSSKTLEKSLQSYEQIGFKDFFDEVKIVFQEISLADKQLACKYKYNYVGSKENLGIQRGHQLICDNITTDYILILENDNLAIETSSIAHKRLLQALKLLENGTIDIMRLRHRWQFGEGFSLDKYLKYYTVENLHEKYCHDSPHCSYMHTIIKPIKRFLRPKKAKRVCGYGIYYEKYPHKLFPKYIKKIDDEVYSVSSAVMNWTNQSVLLRRDLYKKLLEFATKNPSSRAANGFQDLEKPLNSKWWREQNFKIGISDGIFTHNRFDDSWRKSHHAFNKNI